MMSLFKYLKAYKLQAILAPLFKLLEAVFELFVPLVVASIIDDGINGGQGVSYVIWACVVLIVLGIIGLISAVSAQYFAAKAAVGFSKELRRDLFNKIQTFSYSQIDEMGTSSLITRMNSDVNQIQSGVNLILRLLMRSPFIVFGAMIMAFVVNVTAGSVIAITIAILSVVVFTIMITTIPLYKKVQNNLDNVTLSTRENLNGVRVIRAFCQEEQEIKNYENRVDNLTKSQKFVGGISSLMNPLTYAIINVAIIVLIYVGAIKVDVGVLKQGEVIALYNYASQILVELIKFANLIIIINKSFACGGRLKEILDTKPSLKSGDYVKNITHDYINFNDVSVKYSETADFALSNVTFSVKKGETVGIIGGTGSGKTTLINLLGHFYDVNLGEVLIDGVNVNAIGDEILREKFGIVPQKAVLFKGTIRDNLKWGKADATDEEIMSAVKIAQAEDVIKNKTNGLDEMVEEGGKNFSGGQKQRLTIARALVKKPEILIFDDSASALDYATDANLRIALKDLSYNPTVFIVSQRTSSIMHADKIIVLNEGHVVGIGNHSELLNNCEIYKEIYNSQFETGVA
ncbi:MAG: ABC transporter ATP-binding protein [Clostridia bacterium]|nr:ABC transporter ATP-binding protein [Clostridia bacterium]